MTAPMEGDLIGGKYRVLSRLGLGGMGVVYLANVEGVAGFEKRVALKIAHDHLSHDRATMEMFLQEARLSALLQHANIGQIYDLGKTDDDLYYIAMEYVHGRDLRALMEAVEKRDARLPIPIIVHLCARLLEGLDYAHALRDNSGRPLKLVHRDVTPSNCLISYTGEVKLIDFGIAKAANHASRTLTGMVRGKVSYMSPEQAQGEPLDKRSDVFAVGVMLYELLVDERPFEADSDMDVLDNIVAGRHRSPRELDPEVPEPLEAIVQKALARNRSGRYPTAGEMQEALERYLMSVQVRVSAKDLAGFVVATVGADIAVADGAPGASLTSETAPSAMRPVTQTREALRSKETRARPAIEATELLPAPTAAAPTRFVRATSTSGDERPRTPSVPVVAPKRVRWPLLAAGIAVLVAIGWVALTPPIPKPEPPALPVKAVEPARPVEPRVTEVPPVAPSPPLETEAKPMPAPAPVKLPRPAEKKAVLAPPTAKLAELQAFVTVRSNRPSEVFIDGDSIGEAPRVRYPVEPGRHQVRVDCLYDWGRHQGPLREVNLPPDAEAKVKHECLENEVQAP